LRTAAELDHRELMLIAIYKCGGTGRTSVPTAKIKAWLTGRYPAPPRPDPRLQLPEASARFLSTGYQKTLAGLRDDRVVTYDAQRGWKIVKPIALATLAFWYPPPRLAVEKLPAWAKGELWTPGPLELYTEDLDRQVWRRKAKGRTVDPRFTTDLPGVAAHLYLSLHPREKRTWEATAMQMRAMARWSPLGA
jgi:hypothetical protein